MINPNWSRWVWASVTKFMDENKGPYFMFIEGQTRLTDGKEVFFEFRMDGPSIREPSNNYFVFDITINFCLQVAIDNYDAHKFMRCFGWVQSMFRPCIPVYKFGNGPQDDPNFLIGNFILKNSREIDIVKGLQLGQIDPVMRLMQGTVEARYRMDFSGSPDTYSVSLVDDVAFGDSAISQVN